MGQEVRELAIYVFIVVYRMFQETHRKIKKISYEEIIECYEHNEGLLERLKDPTLIAVFFSFIWFIYAVALFTTTFLIEGRCLRKKLEADEKSCFFPLHDIQELQALYEITIKKKNWNRNKRLRS